MLAIATNLVRKNYCPLEAWTQGRLTKNDLFINILSTKIQVVYKYYKIRLSIYWSIKFRQLSSTSFGHCLVYKLHVGIKGRVSRDVFELHVPVDSSQVPVDILQLPTRDGVNELAVVRPHVLGPHCRLNKRVRVKGHYLWVRVSWRTGQNQEEARARGLNPIR